MQPLWSSRLEGSLYMSTVWSLAGIYHKSFPHLRHLPTLYIDLPESSWQWELSACFDDSCEYEKWIHWFAKKKKKKREFFSQKFQPPIKSLILFSFNIFQCSIACVEPSTAMLDRPCTKKKWKIIYSSLSHVLLQNFLLWQTWSLTSQEIKSLYNPPWTTCQDFKKREKDNMWDLSTQGSNLYPMETRKGVWESKY